MNSVRGMLLAATLTLGLAISTALAGQANDADIGILLDAIRANRKALVAANLKLSDDEATKFWPVYDGYQKEMNALQERLVDLLRDYAASFDSMTDDKAMDLAKRYVAIEADRAKVRQDKLEAIAGALPGKKVARFYQIENKMDAVVRYELASQIRVLE